jgi:hypothetical protein
MHDRRLAKEGFISFSESKFERYLSLNIKGQASLPAHWDSNVLLTIDMAGCHEIHFAYLRQNIPMESIIHLPGKFPFWLISSDYYQTR